MKKTLSFILATAMIVILLMPCGALAANGDFTPSPKTAYARDFITKCDGQRWFINEIERLLNSRQKTLDTVTGSADFIYITAIGLSNARITGNIPRAIGELTNLQYLFLDGNSLSGTIPAELFSLANLQNVDLSGNRYSGAIPSGFGTMASLTVLNLKNNSFTGMIPASVLANTRLEVLNLLGNKLTGGIPAEINNMTGLTYLNLSGNVLGGAMPDMGGLVNLKALSLWNCGLTGEIHSSVYTFTRLQILDLADNLLTGELSSGIGSLTALEYLALSNNKLRGTIPDVFGAASLAEIHLEDNYLRGVVPATLKARYGSGTRVYLENNYLTGADLKAMTNNEKNFTDGAATEQYRLVSTQATVQINENTAVNLYSYIRNKSLVNGSTAKKPVLNPDEYDLIYDNTKVDVVVDSSGINVKALDEIPLSDGVTIVISIKSNTGSDYSKVTITLTTDTVAAGGGGGGGGGGGEEAAVNHEPYVNGYPDGTFRPDGSVTREEIAKMLITALELGGYSPGAPSYTDVQSGRWSYPYIERATQLGYLNGYGEGIFGHENSMTRAELAACLVRIAESQGKTAGTATKTFSDVDPNAWFAPYITKASALGLVNGYSDGTFRPNSTVTRAEAVTMINRMLERDPETCEYLKTAANPFSDVGTGHWGYLHILEAGITHEH